MDCPTGAGPAPEAIRSAHDEESWRREVAAHLARYRARRRPRSPRYPSLFLPFDSPENRTRPATVDDPSPGSSLVQTHGSMVPHVGEQSLAVPALVDCLPRVPDVSEPPARVIEFPRSAAIPAFRGPELAEPVLDRPRIVEAPEILPPPPALGGILIEAAVAKEKENNNSPEVPLGPASLGQRIAAASVDGLVLGAALAAFSGIFLRLNPERGPLPLLIAAALAVTALLWAAYEFLFIVYTGATPGLRAFKLRLVRFDGSPAPMRSRRWRVLASFLSALSLGLGYFWSVVDEDGLCWHDRITHTHIQTREH